ncbi:MAG: type II toxin-antitoxin system RelE/ParE family toxin [Nitrospinota bacterium]
MHKIEFKKSVKKELENVPDTDFIKVDSAIHSLKKNPYPFPQSKKLEDEDKFRLRVGDYRIIYTVDNHDKVITIHRVRHRKDVYR